MPVLETFLISDCSKILAGTMSESLHLPSTNKIPDDAGMENKRGCDVIDGTSPQVKRLKNNAGLMSEGELSMKAKISTIASSEDAEADRANNQESETGNNQMEGNYNSVANDHISIDENEKTHGGHQLTLVEADAAEDKGSRHTMEDAWVVLLDASLGTPGKLSEDGLTLETMISVVVVVVGVFTTNEADVGVVACLRVSLSVQGLSNIQILDHRGGLMTTRRFKRLSDGGTQKASTEDVQVDIVGVEKGSKSPRGWGSGEFCRVFGVSMIIEVDASVNARAMDGLRISLGDDVDIIGLVNTKVGVGLLFVDEDSSISGIAIVVKSEV
eukprot:Gb_30930 [translate_table: standard]